MSFTNATMQSISVGPTSIAFDEVLATNATMVAPDNPFPVIEPWIVWVYIVGVLIIGALGNICAIYSILQQKINGTYTLLLQISIVDFLTVTLVAVPEVWSLNNGGWVFNSDLCPIFLGTEVLTGTIAMYLLVLFNLHTLSIWNLNMRSVQKFLKDNNNPLMKEPEYAEKTLLPRQDGATSSRKVNIDYRRNKLALSVILPTILIWTLSSSLSIPEFGLSTTVVTRADHIFCTIVDLQQFILVQFLLCLVRVAIPVTFLCFTGVGLAMKLCKKKNMKLIDNHNKMKNRGVKIKYLVLLAILFTATYAILSLHRAIYTILHVCSARFVTVIIDKFKMPPLENLVMSRKYNLFLSMVHYTLPSFRFLLLTVVPHIRNGYGKLLCFKQERNEP